MGYTILKPKETQSQRNAIYKVIPDFGTRKMFNLLTKILLKYNHKFLDLTSQHFVNAAVKY